MTRVALATCGLVGVHSEAAQPMLTQPTHATAWLRRAVHTRTPSHRDPPTNHRSTCRRHATANTLGGWRRSLRQPAGGKGWTAWDSRELRAPGLEELAARCLRKLEAALESDISQSRDSDPAFAMLQGSNISNQKTSYEVLSVGEDATYDEIRAAYKSAALNTHPDKAHTALKSFVSSNEQQDFFSVQKAWEILCHPKSRAEYDKQLQSSRLNLEIVATDIEIEDMIIESTADAVELLYACRCGDYFSITACELGEMGILVSEDGEIELQPSDSLSTSVVLGCGSCSLKTRLVINKTS